MHTLLALSLIVLAGCTRDGLPSASGDQMFQLDQAVLSDGVGSADVDSGSPCGRFCAAGEICARPKPGSPDCKCRGCLEFYKGVCFDTCPWDFHCVARDLDNSCVDMAQP